MAALVVYQINPNTELKRNKNTSGLAKMSMNKN